MLKLYEIWQTGVLKNLIYGKTTGREKQTAPGRSPEAAGFYSPYMKNFVSREHGRPLTFRISHIRKPHIEKTLSPKSFRNCIGEP